jgi:predicted naringenin-chalcone synthase
MPIFIHSIETGVPETQYSQEFIRGLMEKSIHASGKTARYLHRIYSRSGIETRHSVIRDFAPDAPRKPFFTSGPDGSLNTPDTRARNDIYISESRRMFTNLARKAIENCPGARAADITHVITASCTGFYSPGPDFFIARELGLAENVRRFHVGFMGCQAAFPALKMATAFCRADPNAVALVVCVELCTIHLQFIDQVDSILAGAIFSDGGAAAVISGRDPTPKQIVLEIHDFGSAMVPDTETKMAWQMGNQGFDLILSSSVPDIIDRNLGRMLAPMFQSWKLNPTDIDTWAIHPGGKAILDKIEKSLDLRPKQIRSSREILRQFGNMSSATIFFVLGDILKSPAARSREKICAIAFGPGLTVETGWMEKRNCQAAGAKSRYALQAECL